MIQLVPNKLVQQPFIATENAADPASMVTRQRFFRISLPGFSQSFAQFQRVEQHYHRTAMLAQAPLHPAPRPTLPVLPVTQDHPCHLNIVARTATTSHRVNTTGLCSLHSVRIE